MKKTMVISFIAAAMLLIPCTACHVAESHNEVLAQENKENTVNGLSLIHIWAIRQSPLTESCCV